jgi:hypothetical protein
MEASMQRIGELREELQRVSLDDAATVAALMDEVRTKINGADNPQEGIEKLARDFDDLSAALFNLARFIEERFSVG